MAFEVAVQVTLVREVEFVYQVLETLVCVYEAHFQLNDCKVVYDFLCVLSACTLAYRVEVACGDSHFVGIELHRSVFAEMVGKQHSELIEQFVLVLANMLLCRGAGCLADVLYVEQQRVYGKCYVLSAIVHVRRAVAGFNVKDIYLTENVVQELLLEIGVATLICTAFQGTALCRKSGRPLPGSLRQAQEEGLSVRSGADGGQT